MSTFYIEYEDLYALDRFLELEDADQIDQEIEEIVTSLWRDTGPAEALLGPFFTTFLQSNLLRPLYIYYFSLRAIRQQYARVVVNASNTLLDIAAMPLDIELNPERSFHDEEFYLVRRYLFESAPRQEPVWKSLLRRLAWSAKKAAGRLSGVDVLYLNAGKLDQDFAQVKRKLSATLIPVQPSGRLGWNLDCIGDQVFDNIRQLPLSIPAKCVHRLIELRVLAYLPAVKNRIGVLAEIIEAFRIKLVIASAFTHEDHLCLLAAAKLTGTESLVITHGVTLVKNVALDHYVTYQGTLSEIDPQYTGATQFRMRYQWFERSL